MLNLFKEADCYHANRNSLSSFDLLKVGDNLHIVSLIVLLS